ncbi:MAG: peptidoglycan editing factor PgeF [Nitrospiria bacterium]
MKSIPFKIKPIKGQNLSDFSEVEYFSTPDVSLVQKIKSPVCRVKQVHGQDILNVQPDLVEDLSGPYFSRYEYDGMVTAHPNLALTVYSADCLPLLFFEPGKKVIAAVHAGWKGSLLNICGVMVKKVVQDYQGDPARLRVVCGPSIHVCCFEVQDDVADIFSRKYPQWPDLIRKETGRKALDLQELNSRQLKMEGVLESHIEMSAICTYCASPRLPSYRRDGAGYGRIISGILLKSNVVSV